MEKKEADNINNTNPFPSKDIEEKTPNNNESSVPDKVSNVIDDHNPLFDYDDDHLLETDEDRFEPVEKFKLTEELERDGIVYNFDFFCRRNNIFIILELNEYYRNRIFTFKTGKERDFLITSAREQLEQNGVKHNHLSHIIHTVKWNYGRLLSYQNKKCRFDSFSSYNHSLVKHVESKAFEVSNESFALDPNYHLIKNFFIDQVARKNTFTKNNIAYNKILDQHDKEIDPIIITLEYNRENERIRQIINHYDKSKLDLIFRKIILDEYDRDLGDYRIKIDWSFNDNCQD